MGISQPALSKIESGRQAYDQNFLETAAQVYDAPSILHLLSVDPTDGNSLENSIGALRAASPEIRRQAQAVIEALLKAS